MGGFYLDVIKDRLYTTPKGGQVFLSQGWTDSPAFDKGARLEPQEMDAIVRKLLQTREPAKPVYGAA